MTGEFAWPEVTLSEHDGVRYLHLGTPWVQGAMRIAEPDRVELVYVQRMLAALLWLPADTLGRGRAVQLGLGAGTLTRFTVRALGMATTVVELNPAVVGACRAFFRLPAQGPRLSVVVADAGAWVRRPEEAGGVRLLHVDLYDHEAAAPVLDDEGFYAACRALLEPGGVMAVNLFGRDARFERSANRIAQAFGEGQVWRLRATREGNTILIAGRAVSFPPWDELTARAEALQARFGRLGLPARQWPRMVAPC